MLSIRLARALFTCLALIVPAAASNLIVNSGAETGDLTGWTDVGANGFDVNTGPVFAGDWVFYGGLGGPPGSASHALRQDVDVTAFAAEIDAGLSVSFFSAQARSNAAGGFTDAASLRVEHLSESGAVLALFATGTVTPTNAWNLVADSRPVPPLTRTIRVSLHASRSVGASTDAFFDDVSLALAETNGAAYCVGKVNSLGCVPKIAAAGAPGFSEPGPFELLATNELNAKNGLLFYGFAAAAIPFQGGTLCVQPPLRRTTIQNSGGNPPPASDCSGSYGFDFNAWMQGGQAPNVTAGQAVYAQYWSRDPGSAKPSGLTDAIAFTPSI